MSAQEIKAPGWREIYGLHQGTEFQAPNFKPGDWGKPGGGNPHALEHAGSSSVAGRDATDILLKHTPE